MWVSSLGSSFHSSVPSCRYGLSPRLVLGIGGEREHSSGACKGHRTQGRLQSGIELASKASFIHWFRHQVITESHLCADPVLGAGDTEILITGRGMASTR